jgi:hypothetical protein
VSIVKITETYYAGASSDRPQPSDKTKGWYFEDTASGSVDYCNGTGWRRVRTAGATHVNASARIWENVDISSTDHTPSMNGGVADGVYCDTAGEILKVDTTRQSGYTTPALQAGFNPMEVTKVYKVGSTITGNAALYGF